MKNFIGEKDIDRGRVTLVEIDGRYLITVIKRGWLKERTASQIWVDEFGDAMRLFDAIITWRD